MIDAGALLLLLAAGQPLVAVMPPVVPARASAVADVADVADVQSTLRGAVARVRRVRSVEAPALARLIASAADTGIRCDAALADCAARIGAFGGLDFVVVTRVEAAGAAGVSLRATLALHDCADGREVRKTSALLADDAVARREGLAALVLAVLGEGDASGELDVRAPAAGVVVVDGVERGPAPVLLPLAAGVHEVSWRSARGDLSTLTVEVPVAAIARATFAGGSGWTTSPLALVAGGGLAAGALLALGGGAGAWAVAPAPEARARYTAGEYNDAVALGRTLFAVSVAGAVLAVVGAGALLIAADAGPPATAGALE